MRAVIVDDESGCRSRLARLCEQCADIQIVAQSDSGAAGICALREHQPDLVLLDIELQDMTGFDVLRAADKHKQPMAVMVTGHPEHALTAFEHDVIDFITKPIEPKRFLSAIERARRRLEGHDIGEPIAISTLAPDCWTDGHICAETQILAEKANRIYFLPSRSIDFIESDGNYVLIHAGTERFINRNTLKNLLGVLAPLGFMRIDRSLLINLRRVAFAERLRQRGEVAFVMRGGARLVSGKAYRKAVSQELRRGMRCTTDENQP
jgi:two-component system, LytTR family, response regulator